MIALRTQQIVAYESGLADVIDPLMETWRSTLREKVSAQAWCPV